MTQPRFYVDAELRIGELVQLPAEGAHHAIRVLRLRDGDAVRVFNGRGGEFHGRLRVDGTRVATFLEGFEPIERESPARATLVQSWVATDKLDWIVEKAVELGVAAIVLVPAARSVIRLDGARLERRVQRLREIAVSACCQCGRNRLPEIRSAASFSQGLESSLAPGAIGLLLDPRSNQTVAEVLSSSGPFALLVGPEGGFGDSEQSLATRLGYRPVTLGPRILRTETAGLAALTAVQTLHGDMRRL